MMDLLIGLATLALVHLAAVISPGPSFVVVSRLALSSGRPAGLAAALGLGVGTLIWAVAALFGLAILFEHAQWLYNALRIAGGLFLIYLAVQSWRHADMAVDAAGMSDARQHTSLATAFWLGVLTQLANPKVAVFFASIFLAALPAGLGGAGVGAALVIVTLNEVGWYALVAVVLSSARPRSMYMAWKPTIERVLAVVLGAIGVRLATSQ